MAFECSRCHKTYSHGWPAYESVCFRCEGRHKQKLKHRGLKKKAQKQKSTPKKRKKTPPKQVVYADYIKSRAWKRRAWQAKKLAGFACERCGSRSALTVHHWTYERLGRERDADLSALCWPCHKALHPKYNGTDAQQVLSDLIYKRLAKG